MSFGVANRRQLSSFTQHSECESQTPNLLICSRVTISAIRITILSMAHEIDGKEITDAEIEQLASEAKRGYPVEQLSKRGRRPTGNGPGKVVTVRLDADLRQAVEARAVRDHKNDSEVIRDALRAWV